MLAKSKSRKPRARRGAASRKAGPSYSPEQPVAGFWRIRLKRGGPFVALQIWLGPVIDPDTDEIMEGRGYRWQARLNGTQLVPLGDYWPCRVRDSISREEHDKLCRLSATMDERHAAFDPLRKIDRLKTPVPSW